MELSDVHLMVLSVTVVAILYADHLAYGYVTGRKPILDPVSISRSHRVVWVGLVLMITTGLLLMLPAYAYWLREPAFLLKMGFVATLIVNAIFIGTLSHTATQKPFRELSSKEKVFLMLSGLISTIGWVGAAAIGLYFL